MNAKINLIDVGSVGGLEPPWRDHSAVLQEILCFEPNEPAMRKPGYRKLDAAIWDREAELPFHVYGDRGTGSSLLEQDLQWVRENFASLRHRGYRYLADTWFERSKPGPQIQVRAARLDTVLANLRGNDPTAPTRYHFLKTDTQSGEGHVLRGAEKFLHEECVGVEAELFFMPLYKGTTLAEDVISYLRALGFVVAGRSPLKGSFNSQSDCLFVRAEPRDTEEAQIKNLILSIYGVSNSRSVIKRRPWKQQLRMGLHEAAFRAGISRR